MLSPADTDAHVWLGKAFLATGRYQEAIAHLEKALEASPKDIGLQYDLAQAHLLLSDQITQKIYQQNPHTHWRHLLKGQAYQIEGKLDLAIIEFNEALKLSPDLPGIHESLGEIYAKKRDFSAAEMEFKKELNTNPYDFVVVCALAAVLIETGKVSEAIPALEKTSG